MNVFLPTYTLWQREVIRFLRQKTRLIGALAQPIIFWLLIGSGMNASFHHQQFQGVSYIEYIYPGILLMIILFTSIFSTITIIEDRKTGFLQGVLVAPIPRSSIILGKALGGMALSYLQALLFLLFMWTPLVDFSFSLTAFIWFSAATLLLSFGLTTLGVLIAWPMDSIHGYHAVMSVVLFPLWIFSGAAFPLEGAPFWLHVIMTINPLTYGLHLLRSSFYWEGGAQVALSPFSTKFALLYFIGFCVLIFLASLKIIKKKK